MGQAKIKKQNKAKEKAGFNKEVLKDYCTASPDFNFADWFL